MGALVCRYRAVIDETGTVIDMDYGRRSQEGPMSSVEVTSVDVSHRYPFKATEWSVTGNAIDQDRVSAVFVSTLVASARSAPATP